jgi:hypothetical protein
VDAKINSKNKDDRRKIQLGFDEDPVHVKPDNMKNLVDGVKLMLNKITPKRRRDRIFGNTQKRGNFGGGGGPRGSYGGGNNYTMERDSGRRIWNLIWVLV